MSAGDRRIAATLAAILQVSDAALKCHFQIILVVV